MVEPELCEKTIQQQVSITGIGLFTGQAVQITLCPAPPGMGIVFKRMDLPGCPEIPAALDVVVPSTRCTKLAVQNASVQMVEHLLSALAAFELDNVVVEVRGPEIPSGDGSSLVFIRAIEQAGVVCQPVERRWLKIRAPISWSQGDVHLVALPAPELRISYMLHYPQSQLVGSQFYSFSLTAERYKEEIAPCRTFSFYEEIAPLIAQGVIKGGALDNALVIKGDRIMNPEGPRFSDEMVRHKILDLLGDLALIRRRVLGHIIAVRAGHATHIAFAKELLAVSLAGEERHEVFSNSYVLENC